MRLIDAMRIDFDEVDITECTDVDDIIWAVEKLIDAQPVVDAVPVVHGRWVYYSATMQECSTCQRHTARHKFKYCPHCGSVMEDKYHESAD